VEGGGWRVEGGGGREYKAAHHNFIKSMAGCAVNCYRGTSPIRKRPHPWDPPLTLGISLR